MARAIKRTVTKESDPATTNILCNLFFAPLYRKGVTWAKIKTAKEIHIDSMRANSKFSPVT